MAPTAKSFILDLLSTLRRGTMPVRAVVEAAALFGIEENAVRVALARLLVARQVERDARGRYRLGTGSWPVGRRVTAWRQLAARTRAWSGAWIGIHGGSGSDGRRSARRRRRAMRLLGFRSLRSELFIRPDNLRGGIESLRTELRALGLPHEDLVLEIRGFEPELERRARSLWDEVGLRAAYRESRRALERSQRRLAKIPAAEAMVESFLLGGRVIRQLVLDPLLPDGIVGSGERDALVDAMRGYDRAGRAAWTAFLARHSVPHLRAPADTRMGAGAIRLAVLRTVAQGVLQ